MPYTSIKQHSFIIYFISFLFFAGNAMAQESLLNDALKKVYTSYIPDSIIKYGDVAVNLAQLNKKPEIKAQVLIFMTRAYAGKGDYPNAGNCLNAANEIIGFMHIDTLKADALLEQGKLNQLQHKYKFAEEGMIAGLKLSEKIGSATRIVKAHIYLAEYYRHIAKFNAAKQHIWDAFRESKTFVLPDNLLISLYNRYAAIMSETNQIDSSLYYSSLALDLAQENENSHYVAVSLNEIGYARESKKQYKEALTNYLSAERIWDSLNYVSHQVNVLTNHARVLSKMSLFNESNVIVKKVVAIAEHQKWNDVLSIAFGQLVTNYTSMKDYPKAIENLHFQNDADRLLLQEACKKEIEEKNKTASGIVQEKKLAQTKKDSSNLHPENRMLKGIIILLLLIIALLFIKIFTINRSANKVIK